MSITARSSRLAPVLSVMALLSSAGLATAAIDVFVDFLPTVGTFNTIFNDPIYLFNIGTDATGFVDPTNPANYVRIESEGDSFRGDLFTAPQSSSNNTGSTVHATSAALTEAVNAPAFWRLILTDGSTGLTSRYSFTLSNTGFTDDLLRPVRFTTNVAPGTIISSTPTFEFTQDAAVDPAFATNSSAAFFSNIDGTNVSDPVLLPTDTSWSPAGTRPVGHSFVAINQFTDNPDQTLISVSSFTLLDGPDVLGTFVFEITTQAFAIADFLIVVPTPGTVALLSLATLAATRRRR